MPKAREPNETEVYDLRTTEKVRLDSRGMTGIGNGFWVDVPKGRDPNCYPIAMIPEVRCLVPEATHASITRANVPKDEAPVFYVVAYRK